MLAMVVSEVDDDTAEVRQLHNARSQLEGLLKFSTLF